MMGTWVPYFDKDGKLVPDKSVFIPEPLICQCTDCRRKAGERI